VDTERPQGTKQAWACTWKSAGLTDVGGTRKINEDAFLDRPEAGMWVVADGMGGHAAGDVASRMICEALAQSPVIESLNAAATEFENTVDTVNQQLLHISETEHNGGTIGSTVVGLLTRGQFSICLWAGDSRAYMLRDGQLSKLTVDHSQVEDMVAEGLIRAEDAESHPAANVITRAVGGQANLSLDRLVCELMPEDRIMLCSDGLYKDLNEATLCSLMQGPTPASACDALMAEVLARGATDNVTVVVVDFHEQV
jgi:serine/threonine protein phosphatase PrpC